MVTWVDKMLACDPQHLTVLRVHRIIEETVLHYDPDRAVADEQAALAARHVTLVHDTGPATTEVHMRLDTLDALHLDDTLADLATSLRRLGDTDSLDVRRAKAVGVLDDPQQALDLLTTGEHTPPTGAGRVQLFVHLESTDLTDPATAAVGRSSGWLRPPAACSRPGWAVATWPGSPSARSWTCTAPTPSTGTTHRPGCGRPRSSAGRRHARQHPPPAGTRHALPPPIGHDAAHGAGAPRRARGGRRPRPGAGRAGA